MALGHLEVKIFTRSKGDSAVAKAAYRAGESLFDDRLGLTWNYSRKKHVDARLLLSPPGTPAWVTAMDCPRRDLTESAPQTVHGSWRTAAWHACVQNMTREMSRSMHGPWWPLPVPHIPWRNPHGRPHGKKFPIDIASGINDKHASIGQRRHLTACF